jgi:3-methyladenine DNA glycosylase AlkD
MAKKEGPPTLRALRKELYGLANPRDARFLMGFFKTGPGQYGEGDKFLGLRVPTLRTLARKYADLDRDDVLRMLASPWHEERLLALVIMGDAYKSGDDAERRIVHRDYLAHTRYINNWDLVDASAAGVVGAHLEAGDIALLLRLARSKDLWERRIAIVATHYFIKRDEFGPTLIVAEVLLRDTHDLIHKAVGWMLREVGKRDRKVLDGFLREHYHEMPRTMLRYAIERHPEALRKKYLAGTI